MYGKFLALFDALLFEFEIGVARGELFVGEGLERFGAFGDEWQGGGEFFDLLFGTGEFGLAAALFVVEGAEPGLVLLPLAGEQLFLRGEDVGADLTGLEPQEFGGAQDFGGAEWLS